MADFEQWLRAKMEIVLQEYVEQNAGYGDICESQYLCYLECLIQLRGSQSSKMWEDWKLTIKKAFKSAELLPMNQHLGEEPKGRKALVKHLKAFSKKWVNGPKSLKKKQESKPKAAETVSIFDMF